MDGATANLRYFVAVAGEQNVTARRRARCTVLAASR
jgi:hypothetical protein